MPTNHTHRFDGKGALYAKARPSYAHGLLTYLSEKLRAGPGSVFADIGSGTGIFTRQLLQNGYFVYAVEPNADMRRQAEQALQQDENFVSVCGTESSTTLPEHSVDFVTAAQAFHWFDPDAFRRECQRILKKNGRVLLVYNKRIETALCTQALAALRKEFCPDFAGFSNGLDESRIRDFFAGDYTAYRCDNSRVYDRQGYINRALSSSYSLSETHVRYEEYVQRLQDLFSRFAVEDRLTVPMETVAYIGVVSEGAV